MVLPVLLMVKLPILHLFKLTLLLWPFNLFFPSARQLQKVCDTLATASTLFTFRMRQIVAEREGRQRLERVLRLVFEQESLHRGTVPIVFPFAV